MRDAIKNGNDCISGSGDYTKYNMSEDCLYMNLFVPKTATPTSNLTVMLFLYGGSWEYGGSSFFIYDGAWIAEQKNCIVTIANYRLGPFGFLEKEAEKPPLQEITVFKINNKLCNGFALI